MPIENFGDKINTNGLDRNPENINRNGRPLSFKSVYRDILKNGDQCITWVEEDRVEKRKTKEDKIEYGLKLSKLESLLLRLDALAFSRNERISLDTIKFIWEQFDGKATQHEEVPVGINISGVVLHRPEIEPPNSLLTINQE